MKSILLLTLLLASPVIAQEPDSSSAIFQMREAERNFAKASVMYGRNAAFAEYFAEESVIFTDRWITNGKQFSRERKANPVVLKWEPEFMDIAESRDFGISTGPWEAQEYRPNTPPISTGYYLTVWQKLPGGKWQVILDAGSPTPVKSSNTHEFSFPEGADKTVQNPERVDVKSACADLMNREEQILVAWNNSPLPSTYASFLNPHSRIQRNGHLPSTNADTIKAWIAQTDISLKWKSAGAGVASSGDLGFTYGVLEMNTDKSGSIGHYVRIWRKQPDFKWYIIMEMMSIN
jgi:ketosteroid isomerase-like protein